MSTRQVLIALVLTGCGVSASLADNQITSWGAGSDGVDFVVDQQAREIHILRGLAQAYKFYAEDPPGTPGTGVINNITIDAGATGDFTLLIEHPTAGQPGALHWRAGSLTYANGVCTILGIDLAGNLCSNGSSHANIIGENCIVDGDITVGGTLSQQVGTGARDAKFQVAEIHGDITLGGMVGEIWTDVLDGNVTVGQTPSGATHGDFHIGSGYAGTMQFNDTDPVGYDGLIRIGGDLTGHIRFGSESPLVAVQLFGSIQIDGDMIAPGSIQVFGYVARPNGGTPPSIWVHGGIRNPNSVSGSNPMIYVGRAVPDGGLRGTIAIDGDLENAVTAGPEIQVWTIRDPFPPTPIALGSIAIDYDGWQSGDDWETGATIEELIPPVGTPTVHTYSSNTASSSVYEITPCIGDLNNDGMITGGATGADRVALNEARLLYLSGGAHRDCFVDHYAGLEGSAPYHGDLNCDSLVDCIDVRWLDHFDPTYPCCLTDCFEVRVCRADFDRSGSVGISDLTAILSKFGLCDTDAGYDSTFDFDYADCPAVTGTGCSTSATSGTDCIDISDLSTLLSTYGYDCSCFAPPPGAAFSGDQADSQGEDAAFIEWVRQASYDELMAWYADWVAGRNE